MYKGKHLPAQPPKDMRGEMNITVNAIDQILKGRKSDSALETLVNHKVSQPDASLLHRCPIAPC